MAKCKYVVNFDERARELFVFVNRKRKAGSFHDISIQVENEQFPANKVVLSCFSKFFETMFDIKMQERYQDVIKTEGFDNKVVKMLIDFMYGEEI